MSIELSALPSCFAVQKGLVVYECVNNFRDLTLEQPFRLEVSLVPPFMGDCVSMGKETAARWAVTRVSCFRSLQRVLYLAQVQRVDLSPALPYGWICERNARAGKQSLLIALGTSLYERQQKVLSIKRELGDQSAQGKKLWTEHQECWRLERFETFYSEAPQAYESIRLGWCSAVPCYA